MCSQRYGFLPLYNRLIPGLALVIGLACGGSACASNSLRLELAEAAKKIVEVVHSKKASAIAVGDFTGPRRLRASSGPGIAEVLAEELKKVGIKVSDDAELEIKGDFLDIEDKESDQLAALLKIRILDRSGKVVFEGERHFRGRDARLDVRTHRPASAGRRHQGPNRTTPRKSGSSARALGQHADHGRTR